MRLPTRSPSFTTAFPHGSKAVLFAVTFLVFIVPLSLSHPAFASSFPGIPLASAPRDAVRSTFAPMADAYVVSSAPTKNYGTLTQLRVAASPPTRSYLHFTVSGLTGKVVRATLKVYALGTSSAGYTAYEVRNNAWGEKTINHNNAPALGKAIHTSGAVRANTWTSMDVTSYVKGNGSWSLGLASGSIALALASRESKNQPQLIIEMATPPSAQLPSATSTKVKPRAAAPTRPSARVAGSTPTRPRALAPRAQGPIVTIISAADSYVNSSTPSTNYGTSTQIRVDGSPIVNSYLRFSVQGLAGSVTKVTLRIYANSSLSGGYVVHSVADNTWSESTITYSNAPAIGGSLGSSGAVSSNTWTSVDITPYITGNGSWSIALAAPSTTALSLASRESGANVPQLVIQTSSGATSTPVPATRTPTNPPVAATYTPVPATSTPTRTSSANVAPPNFSHIYMILMENKEYSSIVGSSSAPYINSLIARYGLATNYDALAHPSEPNYIALFSGSTQGITSDGTFNFSAKNLTDQLQAHGKTWKMFAQNVPLNCYTGSSASGGEDGTGSYVRRHEPAISFTDISGNPTRCANITDFTHFDPRAANYEFIKPNLCNDMHDCSISVGDSFLQGFVPTILNSAAWQHGGVLFILWDEGSTSIGGGGNVAVLVMAKNVPPGFRSSTAHNHYSLLRTIEDAWGLGCLVNTCSANNLAEFFR